jgi:hypothetical protein
MMRFKGKFAKILLAIVLVFGIIILPWSRKKAHWSKLREWIPILRVTRR